MASAAAIICVGPTVWGSDRQEAAAPATSIAPSVARQCMEWTATLAEDAQGGAATAADAVKTREGGATNGQWSPVGPVGNTAKFVSGDSTIIVKKLSDGTWIAAQGKTCS